MLHLQQWISCFSSISSDDYKIMIVLIKSETLMICFVEFQNQVHSSYLFTLGKVLRILLKSQHVWTFALKNLFSDIDQRII